MTFWGDGDGDGDRDGDGDGTDGQTDGRTNGRTDIGTDRLFSENIILDLVLKFQIAKGNKAFSVLAFGLEV